MSKLILRRSPSSTRRASVTITEYGDDDKKIGEMNLSVVFKLTKKSVWDQESKDADEQGNGRVVMLRKKIASIDKGLVGEDASGAEVPVPYSDDVFDQIADDPLWINELWNVLNVVQSGAKVADYEKLKKST